MKRASEVVEANSHNFLFRIDTMDESVFMEPTSAGLTGILCTGKRRIVIVTGIYWGPVAAQLRFSSEPPPVEFDEWEDIAETSIESTSGRLIASGPWELVPVAERFPDLLVPIGSLRVRVSVRGRDSAYDQAVDEVCEHYQIDVWPQRYSGEEALKVTSRTANGWQLSAQDAIRNGLAYP